MSVKAVIYATDFSLCSQNAGLYAASLARYFSARLLVAHAFILSQAAMEVEVDDKLVSRQRTDLQYLLARKASQLAPEGIDAIPALVDGAPDEAIPKLAAKHAPSLIVMGTHGGGRIQRGVIGSVAEKILRSTPWPCLTVGPQVPSAPHRKTPFRRILYATDFTPAAAHAAAYAVSFAEAFGAKIDILNVIRGKAVEHPDRLSDLRTRFYTALNNLIPQQAKEFCDPRTFVEVGKAHAQILRHVTERSIDLLVLGIHKSAHVDMEMRLSGAFQLIADATCPVLTIRG
ncbi:MAG TPA: universal stress protein [Silvibacterium sp.]|nr:universal stress protein [Silvibacterium sp.]